MTDCDRKDGNRVTDRTEWVIDRNEATARGGMVAAKTAAAAEAGAETLRRGGNAIDAAVATAFTSGVVEPWMNGIGGGGFLVAHVPDRDEAVVVEFPMVAPAGATPDMFPLSGVGPDTALFGWPGVVASANVVGHRSVAVPGTVAGLALALERFGTISLAEAMAPAIAYAEAGTPVTWHTTYTIARDLSSLSRFPATAAVFCDGGIPPVTIDQSRPEMLRQPDLAATLRRIADEGPRAFYEGEIAAAMADHLTEHGAPFALTDLASYEARVVPALIADYRGYQIVTTGAGSGGTTLVETMRLLADSDLAAMGHNSPATLHLLTQAVRQAFADRFAFLADPDFVDVPFEQLTSPAYARERAAAFRLDRIGPIRPGDAKLLGIAHGLSASMPEYIGQLGQAADGSTTHLSVIDGNGLAVSLTQTLLSLWGSRVVVPGTGILLNNGMMWFDPEPGRPNSVAGGKRPLSNMAPAILTRHGRAVASIGASGGRRIMPCQAQIVSNLIDHGLSMQPAISAPRVDASTPDLLVSARLPVATRQTLQALGHRLSERVETLGGGDFASPVGISRGPDGLLRGGADPYYPAMAVGIDGPDASGQSTARRSDLDHARTHART